jgi:hypothetical protein
MLEDAAGDYLLDPVVLWQAGNAFCISALVVIQ